MEDIGKDTEGIRITWLGTAALKLENKEGTVLIDPFVEMDGAENQNDKEDFLSGDAILITHGHLDHLSLVPVLEGIRRMPVYCTATPEQTLYRHGIEASLVHRISPGDRFMVCGFTVRVDTGVHIHFDRKLVRKKLLSARVFRYRRNLKRILRLHLQYPEHRETVLYELSWQDIRIQVMGSLGLSENEDYQAGADLLCLPYQGSSTLEAHARKVLQRLKPKAVLLTHFDDAYPPVSDTVETEGLKEMMQKKFPDTLLIIPDFRQCICVHGSCSEREQKQKSAGFQNHNRRRK